MPNQYYNSPNYIYPTTSYPSQSTTAGYQQPSQPVPQQSQPNSILTIFVNSKEEVDFYPVAAGVTVMLVAFNLGKFYLKSTGKNGVPEQLREFDFEEKTVMPVQQDAGNYATKDEIDALTKKLDKLISSLGGDS